MMANSVSFEKLVFPLVKLALVRLQVLSICSVWFISVNLVYRINS